ncbi:hypothetical protein FRC12_007932 [Ceratobasidium sp. 428]|nr:hypothetical protein FRC12_007932 [Ceratobasidium sp. 428]
MSATFLPAHGDQEVGVGKGCDYSSNSWLLPVASMEVMSRACLVDEITECMYTTSGDFSRLVEVIGAQEGSDGQAPPQTSGEVWGAKGSRGPDMAR